MTAVRYYSRSGNTKLLAEAIAEAAGVPAVSVDTPEAPITEETDVLFIGGALYAYGLDRKMKDYLAGIDGSKVKKAVVFSTSWLSKHSLDLLKNGLEAKGIAVEPETLYAKNKPDEAKLAEAKSFAAKFI
ncbi:MAG: hypothetical protein K6G12_10190 [Lachnospiraceae bacterium]|nr:hypothetical protein [Lachnospiraceae bacterium]